MNTETIEEEIQINGSRKIVLGVRVFPELKNKLSQEAYELGITLSEHTENILLNKEDLLCEKDNTSKEAERLKSRVSDLTKQLFDSNANHKTESENLKKGIAELQAYVSAIKGQASIHSDERLLHLLSELKGKKDTILTPEKQTIAITYENTNDLLTAMIYSFQLKKP